MSKISLIIQREYFSRVRSRSFILTTFLTPLLFVLLIFGASFLSIKGKEQLKVAVIDENGFFKDRLKGNDDVQFYFPAGVDTSNYLSKGYSALLNITKIDSSKQQTFYVRSKKAIGIGASQTIEDKIDAVVEDNMLQQSGIMRNQLDSIHKNSHIAKIVGIGAVGLTQFLMWIVLIIVLFTGAKAFIPDETMQQVQALQQQNGVMQNNAMQVSEGAKFIFNAQHTLSTANWPLITFCFIFYFLGGYLFYASLFAAVGCVTEDVQSSQSLTLPITMPVIFSFIIGTNAVQVPDSGLAIWGSIIPFSSPIVMMCRIAYGVPGTIPYWQLITSIVALVAGFLITTWLAGKIYRTGILMYGKKTSWKEMLKWAMRKS